MSNCYVDSSSCALGWHGTKDVSFEVIPQLQPFCSQHMMITITSRHLTYLPLPVVQGLHMTPTCLPAYPT